MKVAFVVGQFPALSETFVLNQITGLIDRGIDVDVYSVASRPQPTMHSDVERYGLLERTTYAESEPDSAAGERFAKLALLVRALLRSGGDPRCVLRVLRHGRADAGFAMDFAALMRGGTRRYDVILCHFGPQGQWGTALRNMGLLDGALVTVFHGFDMTRYLRAEGPDVYRRLFAEGDFFLPISRHWRDRLIELGCDPARTQVHHMGVDCDSFAFVERELPSEGPLRLLSVGRLIEKKGVEYAVRAVSELTSRGHAVRYTVIGDGPLRPELEALVAELGLQDHVELIGARQREEVIGAMDAAHVLLAPSVTDSETGDQEGIPVVLMEAMATGLPVLSTYHTGIPELVTHRETGFLTHERDVAGITEAIETLVESPEIYAPMARAARQRVEQEFDVEKLNDQLVGTFRALAAARHSGAGNVESSHVAPLPRGGAGQAAGVATRS